MNTLGEKLKQRREGAITAQEAEKRRREAAEERERQELVQRVQDFFDERFENARLQIESGKEPTAAKVPVNYTHGTAMDPRHPAYEVYRLFVQRLRREGLDGIYIYQHDGMGLESWYEFQIDLAEVIAEQRVALKLADPIG